MLNYLPYDYLSFHGDTPMPDIHNEIIRHAENGWRPVSMSTVDGDIIVLMENTKHPDVKSLYKNLTDNA